MCQPIKTHSNGKLLLTGEYLIMKGALALALPLKAGQSMLLEFKNGGIIEWESHDTTGSWFKASIDLKNLENSTSNEGKTLRNIIPLIQSARKLNPGFIENRGCKIINYLEFPRQWGWGSSSTLISNLAAMANIDPFELFFSTQHGSGYDIACARTDHPILYQYRSGMPVYEGLDFNPPFMENIGFVYSGKKQKTADSIKYFSGLKADIPVESEKITQITKEIASSNKLKDFYYFLVEHEKIISSLLKIDPIQKQKFSDFEGTIKSLGAWGGDFFLAASENGMKYIKKYFENKGLKIIFNYKEIVKNDA